MSDVERNKFADNIFADDCSSKEGFDETDELSGSIVTTDSNSIGDDFLKLNHLWIWWYHKPSVRSDCWEDDLMNMASIEGAPEFWFIYKNLKRPSELMIGADYYVFKAEIAPMWEEEENERGGRLFVTIHHTDVGWKNMLDKCWLEFLIAAMTGQLGNYCANVNGVFVSSRPSFANVGFWLHSACTYQNQVILKETLRALSGAKIPIRFLAHRKL